LKKSVARDELVLILERRSIREYVNYQKASYGTESETFLITRGETGKSVSVEKPEIVMGNSVVGGKYGGGQALFQSLRHYSRHKRSDYSLKGARGQDGIGG